MYKKITIALLLICGIKSFSQQPRKIEYPNIRIEYSGTTCPLFVTDISNADMNIDAAVARVLGFTQDTGFAILSGFEYSNGYFAPGYVMMRGHIYKSSSSIQQGKYIKADSSSVFNKVHGNNQSLPTYRIYRAVTSDVQWQSMPRLTDSSTVENYRYGIKSLKSITYKTITHKVGDVTGVLNVTKKNGLLYMTGGLPVKKSQFQLINIKLLPDYDFVRNKIFTAYNATKDSIVTYGLRSDGFIYYNSGAAADGDFILINIAIPY